MKTRTLLAGVAGVALLPLLCAHAGEPVGTVYVTVDVENRVVWETFGGDAEEARAYFAGIYDELGAILLRDANIALEVSEVILWPDAAPFEESPITAGGADLTTRFNSYRTWVTGNRDFGFLNLNHLWGVVGADAPTGFGLGGVGQYCNGGTAFIQVLDSSDNFLGIYAAGRYLGLGLGASQTTDDTFLDSLVDDDTMLAYGTATAGELQTTVTASPLPCDPPVLLQCNRTTSTSQGPYADSLLTMEAYLSEPASGPVSDNFSALTGTVGALRWWGTVTGTCPAAPTFQVAFTGDAAAQWSLQPDVTDTGVVFNGSPLEADGAKILQFDAKLPTPLVTTGGTVSIANEDGGCTFHWLDSPVATTKAALPAGVNAAFCLYGVEGNISPTPALACPDGSFFSQPCGPIDLSAQRLISDADAGVYAFEHFEEIPGPINEVSWWGVFLDGSDAACSPSSAGFTVRFYEEGASPVDLAAIGGTTTVVTPIASSSLGTVARYTMTIFPAVNLSSGWVSIQTTGNIGCDFHWLGARSGDQLAATSVGANPPTLVEADLAFCLDADIPFSAHAADTDEDAAFSLSEMLRVIQLYNAGVFGCDAGTEDGYTLSTFDTSCSPHDSDYDPQDWSIGLGELLRLVQLFNQGPYENCVSEDDFCSVV